MTTVPFNVVNCFCRPCLTTSESSGAVLIVVVEEMLVSLLVFSQLWSTGSRHRVFLLCKVCPHCSHQIHICILHERVELVFDHNRVRVCLRCSCVSFPSVSVRRACYRSLRLIPQKFVLLEALLTAFFRFAKVVCSLASRRLLLFYLNEKVLFFHRLFLHFMVVAIGYFHFCVFFLVFHWCTTT